MRFLDTYTPYRKIVRDPIQYTYCVDFKHISRYRGLRQVVHQGQSEDRFMALETTNPFKSTAPVKYYKVPYEFQNRLDLIAYKHLGSPNYAWVIAYFNNIQDGFTVLEGTQLAIPTSISDLFENGELLASISVNKMNLGSEP